MMQDSILKNLDIKPLMDSDIPTLVTAFKELGWDKPASLFEKYLNEQKNGARKVWVAWIEDKFVGYTTLLLHSDYSPFKKQNVPEINDLNVLPKFRKMGIGSKLLDIAENEANALGPYVGIGVGLFSDYGKAQRLYVKRDYIPDGCGITYRNKFVDWGTQVTVDDDLVLWFIKEFKK